MRLSDQIAGCARKVRCLSRRDWIVTFTPTEAVRRKWPGLPTQFTCRCIGYQRKGFRPSWLLTSLLDPTQADADELIDLYHRRWQIETLYREWKHTLDIQNLRSHTPVGVLKEVHAQLMLANLARWVMTEAAEGTPQTAVELSFTTALSHLKTALLMMRTASPSQLRTIHQQLLTRIRSAKIRKRPGRSYPRPREGMIKSKGGGKYQLPAKLTKR